MSEPDFVEASSDSFWEVGQYKRTVKRCEDGHKLCNDVVQMIAERAEIEKSYSKNLKGWTKKWNDYLLKGSEYGTMRSTWMAALNEADKLAEIHSTTHNVLVDELNVEIKQWQKENYLKTLVNQLKIAKEYEEEFKKAQKPWAKKYALVDKTKKDYHAACKSYQSAKVQASNSQNDTTISPDQKKKLEDKVEKYKKEVEITKNKYKQALDDLNSNNSRYIEDMNAVYKKCDQFEKKRLEFFIEKFNKLHSHLDIYEKMNIEEIYNEFQKTIRQTNPDKDLIEWSKEYGNSMAMNWPVFQEYSEELKTIAKGTKASKLVKDINSDNNGVTMTSIKHKTDDINETNESRSLSHIESNQRGTPSNQTNGKDSNPFGDDDDDESNNNNTNTNNNHTRSNQNNDDSDEENKENNYLNVKVKALYDYNSAEDDELSFKAGEEFTKLANEDDRGWCLGKKGDKVGLYPATYATDA